MAKNSPIGSAPTTNFSTRLGSAAYGAPAGLRKRPGPGSARCRVVVNQGVTPASKNSRSLSRISPMDHGFEAMLLVLLDLGHAVRP